MEDGEVVTPVGDSVDRTLYGIDGPRRLSRTEMPNQTVAIASTRVTAEAVVVLPDAERSGTARPERSTVRERWLEESREHVAHRSVAPERPLDADASSATRDHPDPDARFEALRVVLATELGRHIDSAVARLERTFEQEIEALRNANHEEAKRARSANGEAFARIRAADNEELERIRRAVDEGVERLCSVLEGQLDRVWGANDVELERIRSSGADRLEEVHDLLTHQLERLRAERVPEPTPPQGRRWIRRARSPSTH